MGVPRNLIRRFNIISNETNGWILIYNDIINEGRQIIEGHL